jgi:hypothetical protein
METPAFWLARQAEFLRLPKPTNRFEALRLTITAKSDLLQRASVNRRDAEAAREHGHHESAQHMTETADDFEAWARKGDYFEVTGGLDAATLAEFFEIAAQCAKARDLLLMDATDDDAVYAWLAFLTREPSPYYKPNAGGIKDLREASAAMCRTLSRRAYAAAQADLTHAAAVAGASRAAAAPSVINDQPPATLTSATSERAVDRQPETQALGPALAEPRAAEDVSVTNAALVARFKVNVLRETGEKTSCGPIARRWI